VRGGAGLVGPAVAGAGFSVRGGFGFAVPDAGGAWPVVIRVGEPLQCDWIRRPWNPACRHALIISAEIEGRIFGPDLRKSERGAFGWFGPWFWPFWEAVLVALPVWGCCWLVVRRR
jgi:hypothetical protein